MSKAITTEVLADSIGIKPQSLRAALCRDGHYFGLRPTRLPNGRLLWPVDFSERLASFRTAEAAPCDSKA